MIYIFIILGINLPSIVNKGNKFYKKGDFRNALKNYNEAELISPNNPVIKFNKGNALYKSGKLDSVEQFFRNLTHVKNKNLRERAYYNLGNTLFKKGNIKGAIDAYINALRLNSKDYRAKHNLELALKMPKQKKNQKNNKDKNKKQNKNNKNKNNKNKNLNLENKSLEQKLQALKEDQKKLLQNQMKKGRGGKNARDW